MWDPELANPDDVVISEKMNAGAVTAFNEDKLVQEAVQKGMDAMYTPSIDMALDRRAKMVRTKLQRLIEAKVAQ